MIMASNHTAAFSGGKDIETRPGAPSASRPSRSLKKQQKRSRPLIRTAATGYLTTKSVALVSKQAFNEDGSLTPAAEGWLTRAVTVQRPVVLANLRRSRSPGT